VGGSVFFGFGCFLGGSVVGEYVGIGVFFKSRIIGTRPSSTTSLEILRVSRTRTLFDVVDVVEPLDMTSVMDVASKRPIRKRECRVLKHRRGYSDDRGSIILLFRVQRSLGLVVNDVVLLAP